jgi:hypothetical protein
VKTILSLRQIARLYDQLRKRYFMDAEPPLHVPPVAADMKFTWLPDNSDAIAQTDFDEDGDAYEMRFNAKFMKYTIARESVLHEITHIRLGHGPSCGGHSHAWGGARVASSMAWHKETLRLAQAGAIRL